MKFPPASDIRRMRKALDITQAELAQESGISQSTIAKIERNRISASYTTVVALFETLDNMAKGHREDHYASDVATKEIISVRSTATVREASEIMMTTGISQLPVLNGEQSVGSISERIIFDRIREGRSMDEIKELPVSEIMDDSFPMVAESTPVQAVT